MNPTNMVPESTDVAVLGGGLAGLAVAALLAEAGARVVVLERMPEGSLGFSARTHGAVGLGYADHPIRLVRSLGEEVAQALVQCSAESLALLRARGWLQGEGLLTASLSALEREEIHQSVELLDRWGLAVEPWSEAQVAAVLGGTAFGAGWFDRRGGWIDPAAVLARAHAWAVAAGAQVVHGVTVTHTRDGRPETVVCGESSPSGFELKADVVVHAAGLAERALDPFFGDKLFPVRFQMQRLSLPEHQSPPVPFCAQLSYLQCAPRADGTVVLGGCRWATPHLEAGEEDPFTLSDAVEEKLSAVRTGLLKQCLGEAEVVDRWAGIMTFTCDGLPIVGPLPGRVGHLACLGWNGRPWSHALRAAVAIRDGLMTGRSTGWPEVLTPQRFV
ncbi:MAG: hypothetical protein CL927_06505 [Deltaproteobacteria bacterium]|nr:hypothetical protein [Deltaproteobacteria bacterium]HCH61708.1 hypothetical protein [Deltaproteobacteria bacterium]